MAVDYDGAFAEVVLSRWNKTSEEKKSAAKYPKRHGRLELDDPGYFALHDTYHYQRGHADVFRDVYQTANHFLPKKDERLLVVDIGAGAATVAVGLSEALGRRKRQRIDYLGYDPHPMMRKLGKQVLKRLGTDFRSAEYVKSLEALEFVGADRVLFTFSYVAHQNAVEPADVEKWARLIRRAVNEVDRAVELIYTTARLSGGVLLDLKRALSRAGMLRKHDSIDVQVLRRYPGPVDSAGRVCWDEQSKLWQVQAEHWILRR